MQKLILTLIFFFVLNAHLHAQSKIYVAAEGGMAATRVKSENIAGNYLKSHNVLKLANTGFILGVHAKRNWLWEIGIGEQIYVTQSIQSLDAQFLNGADNSVDAFTFSLRTRYKFYMGKKFSLEPSLGLNIVRMNHPSQRQDSWSSETRGSSSNSVTGITIYDTTWTQSNYYSNQEMNLELGLGFAYQFHKRWEFYGSLYYIYKPDYSVSEYVSYSRTGEDKTLGQNFYGGSETSLRIGIRRHIGNLVKVAKDNW